MKFSLSQSIYHEPLEQTGSYFAYVYKEDKIRIFFFRIKNVIKVRLPLLRAFLRLLLICLDWTFYKVDAFTNYSATNGWAGLMSHRYIKGKTI